jgi:chromosome segregation ATPase
MTLEKVLAENERLRNEAQGLQEKFTVIEAATARMTQSLALATGEAEVFRRQAGELKLRLEALGVEGGSGATSKVEQRLLTAASDLRLAEADRAQAREALNGLAEAAKRFEQKAAAPDAEAKRNLDAALRKAAEVLGSDAPKAAPVVGTLSEGTVINISDELALVIANLGSRQGVTAGMPFQVLRDNHIIGTVRVVDVREKVAGAIIENLSSEKDRIKVGDRLKVAVHP